MRIVKTLLILALSLQAPHGMAKPKLPTPPDSNITRAGDSMVVNGVPMDVRLFASKLSPNQVLDFYRNYWPKGTKKKPGYTETSLMYPWKIITRVDEGYLMTVQVKAAKGKGSTGYVTMSPLIDPENIPEFGKNFPKMQGSTVINETQTKDISKKGKTILLSNRASVESNANFYRNHYENLGWSSEMDKTISGGNVHTLRFRDGNKSVSIVINKANTTLITALITKDGLF